MIQNHLTIIDLVKTLCESLPTTVVLTDAQLDAPGPHVLYVNPAYEKMTGYKPEEVIGKSPRILQGRRTNKLILRQLRKSLQSKTHARARITNYRKCGEEYICDIAAWPIINEHGDITHFIALEREIKRKRGRPPQTVEEESWWLNALIEQGKGHQNETLN